MPAQVITRMACFVRRHACHCLLLENNTDASTVAQLPDANLVHFNAHTTQMTFAKIITEFEEENQYPASRVFSEVQLSHAFSIAIRSVHA